MIDFGQVLLENQINPRDLKGLLVYFSLFVSWVNLKLIKIRFAPCCCFNNIISPERRLPEEEFLPLPFKKMLDISKLSGTFSLFPNRLNTVWFWFTKINFHFPHTALQLRCSTYKWAESDLCIPMFFYILILLPRSSHITSVRPSVRSFYNIPF